MPQPIRKAAVTLNGITVAYLMGVVNAGLATMVAFGVDLNPTQTAALAGMVNASLILAVHLGHRLGEVLAAGGSAQHSQAATYELQQATAPTTTEETTAP